MVNGASNTMVAEGAALMVNVANGPGNTTDWVGLAAAGTPDTGFIAWAYLNGTQTPPAAGVTSATVMMTAPTSDGPYEARFYPNNAWTVTARSSFTVVGATPAPPPPAPPPPPATSIMVNGASNTMVAEGAALMVNVANGPGNTTDWVGLAAAGTPDTGFIAWAYLNGTQTPPAAGVTSATVMMTAPTSDGPYEARFYPNNAWTVTARSSFTVVGATPAPPPPPAPPPAAVITVTPNTPQVPDTTSVGAVVAAYTVTMSDGSPFVGTIGFGSPNFDAGGIFALAGSPTSGNVIINPNGPGVGPNLSTITDLITLIATQP
jgi:hypothetical protein